MYIFMILYKDILNALYVPSSNTKHLLQCLLPLESAFE